MAENQVVDFLRQIIRNGGDIQKVRFQPFVLERGGRYDEITDREVRVELMDGEVEERSFNCTKDRFIKWQIETDIFLKQYWGI